MRCGPLVAALVATVALVPAGAEETTLTDAVELVRRNKLAEAIEAFRRLAESGDTRAQYLLGMSYLEGRMAPQDAVLGYAWLQVAAAAYDASSKRGAADEAQALMLKVGPMLPGATLIKAEQKAAAIIKARQERLAADIQRAAMALMSPAATPGGVVSGCALEPTLSGCEPQAAISTQAERCTGNIVSPELEASLRGPAASITKAEYPKEARRRVEDGQVRVAAHVDRSGYLCRVTLVQGSGVASIDEATIAAVRRWRLTPGKRGGDPVETIHTFVLSFGIKGKNFF